MHRHTNAMMKSPTLAATFALLLFAVVPASATQNEVIHPGDQLSVQVFGQPAQNVTVLPDGSVDYPLIGRVKLAGMTVPTANNVLAQKLAKYVRNPMVTIVVTQQGQPNVLVLGDVKNPGKYEVRADARLTDAIAAAGGIANVDGPLPDARISDDAGNIQQVSLEKLLQRGDLSQDRPIVDGDVVYVPGPVTFNVVVTGAVDHPGEIPISQGDRLSMAIAKAGNSSGSQADLNSVRVIRTGPDGKQHEFTVNLYQALEKGDTSADMTLQKGDVVYVPQNNAQNRRSGMSTVGTGLLYLLSRLIP
jgi:polysaccharide biosynthesis/export protein